MDIITSVLNQTEGLNTSNRYEVATTQDIITNLVDHGFTYVSTQVAGVKKEENRGFQKHLVTMKNKKYESSEGVPTVLITNSYNRSTGIRIHTGYIRFACSNGLVTGTDIEMLNIRHSTGWEDKIYDFINNYEEKVIRMNDERSRMLSKYMSFSDQVRFAERAVQLRYPSEDILDASELNIIRRPEDVGKDLWKTYNRVQEALLKGYFTRRSMIPQPNDEPTEQLYSWRQAKRITDTNKIVDLNRNLYQLALEYV